MALSADDRLLGEKTHYYCSSSEDEAEEGEEGAQGSATDDVRRKAASGASRPQFIPDEDVTSAGYSGHCSNTGPKGVIEDWRRFRQMETEKRDDQELERLALAKKLSLSCRTSAEDDREKQKDEALQQQLEEIDELTEQFLSEYRQKRLEELRRTLDTTPRFGNVIELNREMFLDAIDKENPTVAVIIHIYEKGLTACEVMNRCLDSLAKEHLSAKFCRILVSEVRLSLNFAISGVPALLVYRHGEMIGNFVRLGNELGDDFCPSDVESFLVENGMLRDEPATLGTVIRTSAAPPDSDSD